MIFNIINSILLSTELTLVIIISSILLILLIIISIKYSNVHKANICHLRGLDFLTDCYNKDGFIKQLEKIENVKLWNVICFDVDSFKQINTNHSFKFGNDVLITISSKIKEMIGDIGILGRVESNRFLLGYPASDKPANEMVVAITNRISKLDYNFIVLNLEFTFGYFTNENQMEIPQIVDNAIENWIKAKSEKVDLKLQNVESADNYEIVSIAESAKSAREEAQMKLQMSQNVLYEAQRTHDEANEKMAKAAQNLEEATLLRREADEKILEAKSMTLEGENAKCQAKMMLDEALRIKDEANKIKDDYEKSREDLNKDKLEHSKEKDESKRQLEEALKIKDEALKSQEEAKKLKEVADIEINRSKELQEESISQREEILKLKEEIVKANEEINKLKSILEEEDSSLEEEIKSNNRSRRDYEYNSKNPHIVINTQQDSMTERRVEEIINSVLKREEKKSDDEKHLDSQDIESMVRRIVNESLNSQPNTVKSLEYHNLSKKEAEKLSSDELENAIRNVMGDYILEEHKDKQTKKEKEASEAEKEKITELLSRLIELQEGTSKNVVINHEEKTEDPNIDLIHPALEPDIIFEDDDEDDDEDEDESKIPQEFIEQLDSKLDIKQFQALMDEYMQKYNQPNEQKVEISKEKAKTLPFIERIDLSSRDSKTYYNMIKNAIMCHEGLINIMTNRYDTFKLGRKVLFKIAYVGKTLKLYLPLDPNIYPNGQYPHKDVSDKKKHVNTPYMMKIKSNLGLKRALVLIDDAMLKLNLLKKQDYKNADFVTRNHNYLVKKANN